MSNKKYSAASLSGLCAVLAGTIFLAGCLSKKKSATTPGIPAATLSPTTLTFSSGVGIASAPQPVTVTNSGTGALSLTGFTTSNGVFTQNNNCGASLVAGGTCTVTVVFTPTATGAVAATLSVADNASDSPQTVALSGTGSNTYVSPTSLTFSGVAAGSTGVAQVVTLTNASGSAVAITSIAATSGFSETNTCGSSVAANGNCSISVTYSATGSGTVTGSLAIVDTSGTQTVALTGTNGVSDQAQVTVDFGVNGNTANASTNYYNGIFTTVTVCTPGTTDCVAVPNVLVDTGSVGLRILSTALTGITLKQITDAATSEPLYECVQYGDLSYTWGPMQMATVQVGGEKASAVPTASGGTSDAGIPIQVVAADQTPPSVVGIVGTLGTYYNPCLYYHGTSGATGGNNNDSTLTLGANGILGVGNYAQDCGTNCETASTDNRYLVCKSIGSASCDLQGVALENQAWNPVAAFPVDNNGLSISLPAINAAGTTTVTGTLTFGIGTESNNSIPNTAGIYELDADGNFASATFNGATYCSSGLSTCPTSDASGGSFIDSGSNAYYVSDDTVLSTTNCITSTIEIGYYCPGLNLSLSLGLAGANNTTATVTLPIENATTLFTNTSYAAFNDLGGPSCVPNLTAGITCDLAEQYFDLGLPFFFGRPIYIGIYGTNTSYPNGYWAF